MALAAMLHQHHQDEPPSMRYHKPLATSYAVQRAYMLCLVASR